MLHCRTHQGLFLARVFSTLDMFSETELLRGNLILSTKTTAGQVQGLGPRSLEPSLRLAPVQACLSLVVLPFFLELGVRHSNSSVWIGSSGLSCQLQAQLLLLGPL